MAKKRKKKKKLIRSLADCSGAGGILGSKLGSKAIRSAAGRKLASCKVVKPRKRSRKIKKCKR